MTETYFRFPHTPHLAWLGEGTPRDDKILAPTELSALLAGDVVVEEKLDGANLGFSLNEEGRLRAQNRGQYLDSPHVGQFTRLPGWMAQHGDEILANLQPNLIAFGEWCTARHSLKYQTLPDWFLLFDVYDRNAGQFLSAARRNIWAEAAGLMTVPQLLRGKTSLSALTQLVESRASIYREGSLEGVVVRKDSDDWCEARAKLVSPEFTQAIDTHWRNMPIEWNRLR